MPATPYIDRRHFLRTAGAALVLPALESMGAPLLRGTIECAPTRFVALYFPNGCYPDAWKTGIEGGALKLGGALRPLQAFSKKMVTFNGVDHPLGGHLGQTCGFLSGSDFAVGENGAIKAAKSLDQMIAQTYADETYLPSLNLAIEPPSQGAFGRRPRSYGNSISWSSATTKVDPQINPQLAFDQVFYGQSPEGRRAAAHRIRLIDSVWGEARSLRRRVSHLDTQKLDQYFDSLRDLEAKLEKSTRPSGKSWHPKDHPPLDRPKGAGIPSDHTEHMQRMLDIIVLALQTDSTRVATHVLGHSISRIVYDCADAKIRQAHHELSHHRNSPKKVEHYNKVSEWFSKQCAYLAEKMDAVDEGDGSLLDHSVLMFGSGMSDGNTHDSVNVPVTLIGGAGGRLQGGRHLSCPEGTVLADINLSTARMFGLEMESFNGATSRGIPGLYA